MAKEPRFFRSFPTREVTIVGRGDPTRRDVPVVVKAHVQARAAFLAVDAPIFDGDTLEVPDPRGGVAMYRVSRIDVHDMGPEDMRHLEAHLVPAAPPS